MHCPPPVLSAMWLMWLPGPWWCCFLKTLTEVNCFQSFAAKRQPESKQSQCFFSQFLAIKVLTNGTASDRLVNMLVYLWMCSLECTLSTAISFRVMLPLDHVFTAQKANLRPWLFLYRSTLLLQRVVWHFLGPISNALPEKYAEPFLAPPQTFLLSVACALIHPRTSQMLSFELS